MEEKLRDEIYSQAKEWVMEAGRQIRSKMNESLTIDTKLTPNDLVTSMDKEIENFFVTNIKNKYEHHAIVSEEGFGDKLTSLDGTVWIIDPIDGTMNFVHQKQNFAISLAVFQDGVGEIGFIYDVMRDVLYHAKKDKGAYKGKMQLPSLKQENTLETSIIGMTPFWLCTNRVADEKVMQQFVRKVRGTRSYGSAALEFAYVAEGILDGYISLRLSPWDIAAGMIIVNEVGGVTSRIDGEKIDMLKEGPILTCNAVLQDDIIAFIEKGRK